MLNDAAVTVAVWNQLVCLVREPHQWRPGQLAWWIRLRFGTSVPKRFGPFRSEEDARQAFAALTAVLERTLKDAACDAANSAEFTFVEEVRPTKEDHTFRTHHQGLRLAK